MVHSLNAHYFDLEGKLLGATRWLMATSPPPDKGMFMGIPVGGSRLDGLLDLFPSLKTASFERQGTEHLPPGFDQVQVGSTSGLIDKLRARMMDHEEQ